MKARKRAPKTVQEQTVQALTDPYLSGVITFPDLASTDIGNLGEELTKINKTQVHITDPRYKHAVVVEYTASSYQLLTPVNPLYALLACLKIIDAGLTKEPRVLHDVAFKLFVSELNKWAAYFTTRREISESALIRLVSVIGSCRRSLALVSNILNDYSSVLACLSLYKFVRNMLKKQGDISLLLTQGLVWRAYEVATLIIDQLLRLKLFDDVKKHMLDFIEFYQANQDVMSDVISDDFSENIAIYQENCAIYFRAKHGFSMDDSRYLIAQWKRAVNGIIKGQGYCGSYVMMSAATQALLKRGKELSNARVLLPLMSVVHEYYQSMIKYLPADRTSSYHEKEEAYKTQYEQDILDICKKEFPDLSSVIAQIKENPLIEITCSKVYYQIMITIRDLDIKKNFKTYVKQAVPESKLTETDEQLFVVGCDVAVNLQTILEYLQNLLTEKAAAQVLRGPSNKNQQAKAPADTQHVPSCESSFSYGQATQRLSKNAQRRRRRRAEKQEVESQPVKTQAAAVASTAPATSTAALVIQWQGKWRHPHDENSPHEQVHPLHHPAVQQGFFGYVPAEVRAKMSPELANQCDDALQSGHFVRHGQGIKYVTGQERTKKGLTDDYEYKLKLKGTTTGNTRVYGHIQDTTQVEQQDRCLIAFDRVAEKAHSNRPVA